MHLLAIAIALLMVYVVARAFLPGLFSRRNYSGGNAPRSEDGDYPGRDLL